MDILQGLLSKVKLWPFCITCFWEETNLVNLLRVPWQLPSVSCSAFHIHWGPITFRLQWNPHLSMGPILLSSCSENGGVDQFDPLERKLEDRRWFNSLSLLSSRDYTKVWFLLVTLDRILWIPLSSTMAGFKCFSLYCYVLNILERHAKCKF